MPAFLIANWKWLLSAIVSAILVGGIAFLLHTVDVDRIRAADQDTMAKALKAQADNFNQKVKAAEANNEDFETQVSDLDDQHDADIAALGVCRHATIKLQSGAKASSTDGAHPAGKPLHKDAADIGDFLNFARDAEKLRLQLISCKRYVDGLEGGK